MGWFPKELEERNQILFDKLVPAEGKCDTLEGETLRAINRLVYRYFNDGDKWFTGYGCETAGPAAAFLYECSPILLVDELDKSEHASDKVYEEQLQIMATKILEHIDSCNGKYTPNEVDMHDMEAKYEDDRSPEDDWDD